jgi:hypothetical protein
MVVMRYGNGYNVILYVSFLDDISLSIRMITSSF